IKALLDGTGGLWAKNALAGKFAGTFFSTSSQHRGKKLLHSQPSPTYFVHHGINYVPLGFRSPHLNDNTEIVGGSPYGAGTITNPDGSRQPSKKELEVARTQGELFGNVVATHICGRKH
ncbi:flavoprotein-like protein, partial [Circinella umbellata]